MTSPITIVERTARVGVLDHLDELERLMREYCAIIEGGFTPDSDQGLTRRLTMSNFLLWLRQRQRESVAGTTETIDRSNDKKWWQQFEQR